MVDTHTYSIQVVKDTLPNHLSEDTYFIHTSEKQVVMMLGDGAPQRVKTTHSMRPLLDRYGPDMTPGGYAARYGRDRLHELLSQDQDTNLRAAILKLNAEIGVELTTIYGALTTDAVLQHEPTLDLLREDPRYIRLILPAACITAVRVHLHGDRLDYAHGADTALIIHYEDGHTEQITPDQMGQHDERFLKKLQQLVRDGMNPEDYPTSLANHIDVINGIYHNYVDKNGNVDPTLGVGVLNGLPEMEHYLVTGSHALEGVRALLLVSDGAHWAVPLDNAKDTYDQRLAFMRARIEAVGLHGYVREKRAYDTQDFPMEQFPVVGRYDDITAIYMQLHR